MTNLKEDLNAYLSRNDSRNGINISLGMNTLGKFLKKPTTEENEDLLTSTPKYSRCDICPTLSRFQRIVGFCLCICIGTFFFGFSLLFVPVLVLKARKFALLFTLGSISYICSFGFLWGPVSYLKHVFSLQRLPFTAVYFGSLLATLYFSLAIQSTALTALSAVIQAIALIWYLVTYIPGGQTGLSAFRAIFTTAVTSSVSRTLPVEDQKIDINKPRWDQNTYVGRLKYFFLTTNPLNILKTNRELEQAKEIIDKCRSGQPLVGITIEEFYRAKNVYDSAYHPETGEKMLLIGRMSAQVPMNMMITGCLITFYKSTPAVIFWQWFNQSFNALVNYTNRSGSSNIPTEVLAKAYFFATSGALVTALSLNKLAKRGPPIAQRLVPFAAVAAAHWINIPLMRYKELEEGITVVDDSNNELGKSRKAAIYGITTVVISRICMCAPGMLLTPFIMEGFEKKGLLKKFPWTNAPLQIMLSGFFLTFATPMACALFPQTYPIPVAELENEIQEKANNMEPKPKIAYYNKGL